MGRARVAELRRASEACRSAFIALAAFSACINILMLTAPMYMLQVFDRVLTSRSTDTLLMLTLIAGAALATMAALEGVRSIAFTRLGAWLETRLGDRVLQAAVSGSLNSAEPGSSQGLRDLATVRSFIGGPSMVPIMDAPWTPIFVAVSFLLHPVLGWMAVCGAIVLLALAITNELSTRRLLKEAGDMQAEAIQQADTAVRNADSIEAMGMHDAIARRWARSNARSLALQTAAGNRSGVISGLSKFVRLGLQMGMLGVGALLVIANELSPGGMIAATILLGRALAPVDQAIGSWKSLVAARGAFARLRERLENAPLPRDEAMSLPRPRGELLCEGVTYSHPGAREPTLKGISFALAPGKVLGLVGPSAAGKTTLARLLVGNLEPTLGHVRLDGMNVTQWPSHDRGRHVGYLPQDVELFAGTIRENIARMQHGDAEQVVKAARRAGVHEMILRLPKGYESEVGPGGVALSGGQRQRIALARALYGDPSVVILDEPNANLDHAGMVALLSTIRELRTSGTTVVVVAHLPIMVRQADYLVVLGNGTVQMSGPMEQVIAKVTGPARGVTPHPSANPGPRQAVTNA